MTIDRFEKEYVEYHGLSEKRAVEQIKVLGDFEAHAGKPLATCGAVEFKAFLAHELDLGRSVNTVRKKAGMIRPYFGWAFDVGLVNGDTLMAIKRVRDPRGSTGKTLPKPYSAKELKAFWSDLDERWPERKPIIWKRWRNGTSPYRSIWRHAMRIQIEAIVRLALDCGMRREEIFRVGIDDIHPDNFYIVVHGKRESARVEKVREVPFTKQSRVAVDRWLQLRSELLKAAKVKDHGSVWLSIRPSTAMQPMSSRSFERRMGTIGPYGLHRFRHTCATHWLRAGVDLQIVSELLGHSNIQQTLCYAEIVREDIHKAMHKNEDAFERLANAEEA
jgi:integrase